MEDVIYEDNDMFEIAYKELNEIKEIRYTIAKMYPERIAFSDYASKDLDLCRFLTQRIKCINNSIYQLNVLTNFSQSEEMQADEQIIKNVSNILSDKLVSTPRYRFDYKEPNKILDDIFSCELNLDSISSEIYDDLIAIDPVYITKLGLDLEL